MTNKEAILVLKRIEDASDEWAGLNKYAKDAFDMAIKALEGKDTDVPNNVPDMDVGDIECGENNE